jgi:hypothetical protein
MHKDLKMSMGRNQRAEDLSRVVAVKVVFGPDIEEQGSGCLPQIRSLLGRPS